jgi:hypothetical protein
MSSMSETYITNRGVTETVIRDNNRDRVSQIKWEANYNGESANIHLVTNDGGPTEHYSVQLTNEDLANMLNIPSDKASLEDQLAEYRSPRRNKLTHISSPRSDEELIVPNMTRRSKTLRAYKVRRKPKTRRSNRSSNKTSSIRRNLKRTLNTWL